MDVLLRMKHPKLCKGDLGNCRGCISAHTIRNFRSNGASPSGTSKFPKIARWSPVPLAWEWSFVALDRNDSVQNLTCSTIQSNHSKN